MQLFFVFPIAIFAEEAPCPIFGGENEKTMKKSLIFTASQAKNSRIHGVLCYFKRLAQLFFLRAFCTKRNLIFAFGLFFTALPPFMRPFFQTFIKNAILSLLLLSEGGPCRQTESALRSAKKIRRKKSAPHRSAKKLFLCFLFRKAPLACRGKALLIRLKNLLMNQLARFVVDGVSNILILPVCGFT